MMKWKALPVIACILFCASGAFAQNMLLNPGFEQTGGSGPWTSNPTNWITQGNAGGQEGWAAQPDVGGYLGCWFGGWIDGGYANIGQDVSISETNGTVFRFTINAKCEEDFTSSGSELYLKFEFYRGTALVLSVTNDIYAAAKASDPSTWNTYGLVYTNPVVNATALKVLIIGGQFHNTGGSQSFLFDNASLVQYKTESAAAVSIFSDDFESGTFTNWSCKVAGDWTNSTTHPINGLYSLWSAPFTNAVETYVSARPVYAVSAEKTTWRFTVKDDWGGDPSANNRFHVWLMADSSNLGEDGLVPANGYAVGPDAERDDFIKLWRFTSGSADVLLITSAVQWVKKSTNAIEVTRTKDGIWSLAISRGKTFDNLVNYGAALDTAYTNTSYFGLFAKMTKTSTSNFWMDDVSISQARSGSPYVMITNPSESVIVTDSNQLQSLRGVASNAANGLVYWKNNATLDAEAVPVAESRWSVPSINLNPGTNIITVTVSNASGTAYETAVDYASLYGGVWTQHSGTASGFNLWELEAYGGTPKYVILSSTNAGPDITGVMDSAGVSFALYSFSGDWAGAYRYFTKGGLVSGDVFQVDLAVNYLDGGRGFDLLDSTGTKLLNFHCAGSTFSIEGEGVLPWPNNERGYTIRLRVEQLTDAQTKIVITRSDGNEWVGLRNFARAPGAIKFYAGGMNSGAENARQYLYVNNMKLLSTSPATDTISVFRNYGNLPYIAITNPAGSVVVEYPVDSYTIGGKASNTVGVLSWVNSANGQTGAVAAATTWTISGIPLAYGQNAIRVSGVNSSNQTFTTLPLYITRRPPPPSVAITLPATNITVNNLVDTYTLAGTADQAGNIRWTNTVTQTSGIVAASTVWGITNASLAEGDNYFLLTATNERGYVDTGWDNASESAYSGGWTSGINGGEGLGAWELTSGSDITYSVGTSVYGTASWGLSALNASVAEAVRSLGGAIGKGDEVSVQLAFPSAYHSAGLVFQNAEGQDLLAFYAKDGICYVRHGNGADEVTRAAFSTNGMTISFVFNSSTTYVAQVVARDGRISAFKGTLIDPAAGLPQATSIKLWYYYEGASGSGVYYVNDLRRRYCMARDYVLISRESSNMPSVIITAPTQLVTYVDNDVTNYSLIGTCNASTVGNLRWMNSPSMQGGVFPAALGWTQTLALVVGTNAITITGTNNLGESRSASVTIIRDSAGIYTNYPSISITYPVAGLELNYVNTKIVVTGICSEQAVGNLTRLWNVSQGTVNTSVAITVWTVTNQALSLGVNEFYARVDNGSVIRWADDEAGNPGYDYGGWTNGSGEGVGMNTWALTATGVASNRIASGTKLGTAAWALYASSGAVMQATRTFSTRLRQGDQMSVSWDHGIVQSGGKSGVALVNNARLKLLEVYCQGGAAYYSVTDASGIRDTEIASTNAVVLYFNLKSETNYVLLITSLDGTKRDYLAGTLKNPLYGAFLATGFELWNSGAGVFSAFDRLYVDGGVDAAYTYVIRNQYPQRPIWINELHYANDGPDTNEGVEVAGHAGESLNGYQLVNYVGAQASSVSNLQGTVPNEAGGYGAVWIPYASIANNPSNGFALTYVSGSYTQVVNYVTWGGKVLATSGPAAGLTSDFIGNETNGTPVDYALQLIGMATNYMSFRWIGPSQSSRGRINAGQFISSATNVTGIIPDVWWFQYFTPSDSASATTDNDGDGYTNYQEFLAGTNPRDANSLPMLSGIDNGYAGLVLTFATTPKRNYTLWWTTDLLNTHSWTELLRRQADSDTISITVSNHYTNAYYRMGVSIPGWE